MLFSDSHSQIQPNMSSIPLDNLNHGDYTASQIRLHRQQLHRGISSRHSQYAASTASYYSSSNSLTAASEMQQGYYSSSQAPDDHYDSSDYRVSSESRRGEERESFIFCSLQDDYDSDYSHGYSQRYLNRRYLPPLSGLSGEMSVVSFSTSLCVTLWLTSRACLCHICVYVIFVFLFAGGVVIVISTINSISNFQSSSFQF